MFNFFRKKPVMEVSIHSNVVFIKKLNEAIKKIKQEHGGDHTLVIKVKLTV